MSRKHHRRDYNGRQGSSQRPWEQEQADWQNRGSMQRNQYDNIGRDRYGSNTGQGGGYGSRDWDRGDDEGGRPNWPGDQGRQQYGSQGSSSRNYDSQGYGSQNYGSKERDQGEEYGDQRYGNEAGRRYRSQGFGGDQGMSRYQSGGYGQNYGDDTSRGGRDDYQNWGEGDAEYGGSNQSQRNFNEGNWNRGQGGQGRSSFGSQGGMGRSQNFAGSQGGSYGSRQQWGGSRSGSGGQGEHTGRGPKGYRRSDERIQEDISEELTRHPEIDASEIEVKVSNGEVTLTGTVDSREAKRMAEDCAEGVSGVNEVQNQIRVQKTVGSARSDEDQENGSSRSKSRTGSSTSGSSSTGSGSESSKSRSGTGVGA